MTDVATDLHEATCPACGHHVAVTFFKGQQPLATIAWPKSAAAAQEMTLLPLEFMRCVDCGHVYNTAFEKYRRGVPTSPLVTDAQVQNVVKFMHISKGMPVSATRVPACTSRQLAELEPTTKSNAKSDLFKVKKTAAV